ncbi:hypothetical protein HNQ80_001928 [Anaerosolibacter carboniphilus]|uniref:Uncharacterized protein n=1 Tax=Anaerosolibacter carboniphilus TaxID=1417629 RepID=A0A841KQZ1_9FIRM|nr:hypothetical protein [Anaerosolibacter carboniphilus]MBB6215837.1 hypothetical protein [Anaerosolibacter carboniphilus]
MPLNEKFVINLQGKNFVTYEGLLDLAHQQELTSISVELLQFPSADNNNTAVCKATVEANGRRFIDFGDASPNSVRSNLAPHIIRMASTRAKARALRDFTNIGMTALEELDLKEFEESNLPFDAGKESIQNTIPDDPPTKRQLETIKKLSNEIELEVDIETLTKRTAAALISEMLSEKYKRH